MKSNSKTKRFIRNVSWLFIIFCMSTAGVMAQIKVSGTVTDNNKDPLIGVNITVSGSKIGTINCD
jgi:hypothetical protein